MPRKRLIISVYLFSFSEIHVWIIYVQKIGPQRMMKCHTDSCYLSLYIRTWSMHVVTMKSNEITSLHTLISTEFIAQHDDVIKWKHFPRSWPFVRGIHRSTVNSPHKGQWRGALMFSLISTWINAWVNNHKSGKLRRHHGHYDVTVINMHVMTMKFKEIISLHTLTSTEFIALKARWCGASVFSVVCD